MFIKRTILCALTLLSVICVLPLLANYEASFKLLDNDPEGTFFNAEITLKNNSQEDLNEWVLCLDSVRPFEIAEESIQDVTISKTIGEYHELLGSRCLSASESLTFRIKGQFFIKKYTDTPSIYFLVVNGKIIKKVLGVSDLGDYRPGLAANNGEPSEFPQNGTGVIRLIPAPLSIEYGEGVFEFSNVTDLVDCTHSKEAKSAIKTFLENYQPLISKQLLVLKCLSSVDNRSIVLKQDPALGNDAYRMTINQEGIQIEAHSQGGYLYGLISLFKLAYAWKHNIPSMTITDAPRFFYRGAMLDPARNFQTITEVKKYLKMMALYKLNVFHWHLTDDEGWRISVSSFPNLTRIGGFRGFRRAIPPLDGSSYKKTGGFYTQEEIRDVIHYANRLNITIIPEIDVPGHCRALIVSFKRRENPLVEKEDASKYVSVQFFTDNVLNPGLKSTYHILQKIMSKVLPLFAEQKENKMPFSNIVHLGSDEVPSGAWLGSPACKKVMEKNNFQTAHELQHFFIRKVQKIAAKNHFTIAGWEEILEGGEFPEKDVLVYSWKGEEAGFAAAEKGFQVIMAPAQFLYLDLSYSNDVKEPGFYWAGYVDSKQIYSYNPVPDTASDEIKKNVLGIEAPLWGDSLVKPRMVNRNQLPKNFLTSPVEYMAFPKMTAYAEVAWSTMANRNWKTFVANDLYEKEILDLFDIKYRTNPLE